MASDERSGSCSWAKAAAYGASKSSGAALMSAERAWSAEMPAKEVSTAMKRWSSAQTTEMACSRRPAEYLSRTATTGARVATMPSRLFS